ncbi:glycosyltransferase family 4 protein [Vibrio cyclitrophicus]
MRERIYVIHEFGIPSHYAGLERYLDEKDIDILFYEFTFLRQLLSSIKHRNVIRFLRSFENAFFILRLLFSTNKKVVVGIAPIDSRLVILKRIISKHNIYYHTSWPYWSQSNYPKISFYQKFIVREWRDFINNCVHVFSVTDTARQSLVDNGWKDNGSISVVGHAYDESIFKRNDNSEIEIEESISLEITFIGRVEHEKGIDEIIEISKELPNARINIIGSGRQDSKLEKLSQKNLNLVGYINDKKVISDYLTRSHYLLLPSKKRSDGWEELFGMVVIEAMACGCIPFVTDHVGPREILKDFPELISSETDYVKNFLKLLGNEELLISKAEIEFASRKYSLDEVKTKWSHIDEN